MPQIWWCVQIFHLLISFFGRFSKWSAGVNIHLQATISMRFYIARLMARTTLTAWHPHIQMIVGCEVYVVCSYTSFCDALCCSDPCLMFDEGFCFLLVFMIPTLCDVESSAWCTCFHDFSCFVWDPFVVCWWDTHVSPCMLLWDPFYAMLAGYSSFMSFMSY